MAKVVVGMSGGVDSAVAAYLLKEQGYDVVGVMLRTWVGDDGQESRCCEIEDARSVCRTLGIPFHVFNCLSEFDEKVIKPFVCDYLHGLTPNPCVLCNREIKWERLLYFGKVLGADLVATGHYASVVRLENGRYTVQRARHAEKDQTYMLCRLSQEQLSKTLMPLADYSKEAVRSIAARIALPVAEKPDSQEICFIPDGNYADYVEAHADRPVPGEGNYVDEDGKILGRHKGVIHYTVGQRKGLGVALGRPAYVKKLDAEKNEVTLCTAGEPLCRALRCRDLNWLAIPAPVAGTTLQCTVRVRYRHAGESARLEAQEDGTVKVLFAAPVRHAAPGQTAVFYDEDERVLGGGVIADVTFEALPAPQEPEPPKKKKPSLPRDPDAAGIVYRDEDYILGRENKLPYLIADGARYDLTCSPYEPCLYVTDADGDMTAVHNSFDPDTVLWAFDRGKHITSITGREYDVRDFCKMVVFAAGQGNIGIDDAEKVFGERPKAQPKPAPQKAPIRTQDASAEVAGECPDDPFYKLLEQYPDCVVDYCIVTLPYAGAASHRQALQRACRKLFADEWAYDVGRAVGKPVETAAVFTSHYPKDGLNYRKAFLYPPYACGYSGTDFVKVNAALFPEGTDELEVYEWTTDWSDYFDEGHEWWGTLCLTVYDRHTERFAVLFASATD